MTNSEIATIVAKKAIEIMEREKKLIWTRPFNPHTCNIAPGNLITRHKYSGFNAFMGNFFEIPLFLTFKQVQAAKGLKINKGAKTVPIIYYKMLLFDKNNKLVKDPKTADREVPLLRYYSAFNVRDVSGIDLKSFYQDPETFENESLESAERIIKKCNTKGLKLVNEDKNGAFYHVIKDFVNMPDLKQFKSSEHYYSTFFHESIHWTGHEKRLDRFTPEYKPQRFGDKNYSFEELVAELGASGLCSIAKINNAAIEKNSAAYLQSWLKALKRNPEFLLQASAKAQKAIDFIIAD